jgi:TatD DNase family protein
VSRLVSGWIDSHCHLGSIGDGTGSDLAIEEARAAGVVAMVCVGTDLESSRVAVDLATRHPDVHATVGLHPHDASELAGQWSQLVELARDARVVAIGETGFDHHYAHSTPADQDAAFRAQIRLAHELDQVLVIHSREAWDDTFRVLVDEGVPPRTVFHCFTGGPNEASRALDLGAHLSFSGIVSFKNAGDVREAARRTPPDRMLVETDAPYLAPVPHRGQENRPAWVVEVGQALAEAVGRDPARLAAETQANTARLFGFRA